MFSWTSETVCILILIPSRRVFLNRLAAWVLHQLHRSRSRFVLDDNPPAYVPSFVTYRTFPSNIASYSCDKIVQAQAGGHAVTS